MIARLSKTPVRDTSQLANEQLSGTLHCTSLSFGLRKSLSLPLPLYLYFRLFAWMNRLSREFPTLMCTVLWLSSSITSGDETDMCE